MINYAYLAQLFQIARLDCRQGRIRGGVHWAMPPPLRSPNFTLDIVLSWKKVFQKKGLAPPLGQFLNLPLIVEQPLKNYANSSNLILFTLHVFCPSSK